MSSTIAYGLHPGASFEQLKVFRNSWCSAPVAWGVLFSRYVLAAEGKLPNNEAYYFRTADLCALWTRMDIPKAHRVVLAMTFDNAYISKKNYARAAADIRIFLQDFKDAFAPNLDPTVSHNHWVGIAYMFECAPEFPAVGFLWTTVCENPFEGPWNEETESCDPCDWALKWELYEKLDALDTRAGT